MEQDLKEIVNNGLEFAEKLPPRHEDGNWCKGMIIELPGNDIYKPINDDAYMNGRITSCRWQGENPNTGFGNTTYTPPPVTGFGDSTTTTTTPVVQAQVTPVAETSDSIVEEFQKGVGKSNKNVNNFHWRNMCYMFTYRFHIPKAELKAFIKARLGEFEECYVCHEQGHTDGVNKEKLVDEDNTVYEHTHALVKFAKSLNIKKDGEAGIRLMDISFSELFPGYEWFTGNKGERLYAVHPNVQVIITNSKHWKNSLRYVGKEDDDCRKEVLEKHPTVFDVVPSVYETVAGCKTKKELLEKIPLSKAGTITGMLKAFEVLGEDGVEIVCPELMNPWQQVVYEAIFDGSLFPNKRSVTVIMDPEGGTGKSDFATYMMVNHPKQWIVLDGFGAGNKDFAEMLKTHKQMGWDGSCMIVDLPRDSEDNGIYKPIESYKCNRITSSKWAGKTFFISARGCVDGNKCILFTNWWPKLTSLSKDRWNLFQIHNMELHPVDYYTALKERKEMKLERNKVLGVIPDIQENFSNIIGFGPNRAEPPKFI